MGAISSIAGVASLSASAVSQLTAETSFSTSVGGKTYNADVVYSNGEYVATDSNLAGAEASGSSVQAAENNLTTRIDILV